MSKPRIVLEAEKDVATLDTSSFPVIDDFEVALRDVEILGAHVELVSASRGRLASFPWWDHADADLRTRTIDEVPRGTRSEPFRDMEQGWELLLWEHDGYVHVLEGDFERSLEFETWFRVPTERYLASWQKVLEHVRASGGAFDDLDAALEDPERVTALVLGNAGHDALSPEIGRLVNVQSLNLYMNRLTTLPPEIGRLKRLRWVDLRYNRITTLPETCASLEALESINLAGNRLEAIPEWVATMPKLRTFYVSSNPIAPASLEHIRRLRPDLDLG